MKEMLRYMWMKLRAEKGEVSVEWVLVAVIMAIIIITVFNPTVSNMLSNGITAIGDKITAAGTQ